MAIQLSIIISCLTLLSFVSHAIVAYLNLNFYHFESK